MTHAYFEAFLYLYKECYWDFDRDCIKSIDYFKQYRHFNNINSFNLLAQNDFPITCIFLIFLHVGLMY